VTLDTHLATLETSGLIVLQGQAPELEYLFRHVLVQDAAYESLLRTERRRLHLAAAETLLRLYPEREAELAAVLAHHFGEAGEIERAVHYHKLAGDQAVQQYAMREALGHYAHALALAGDDAPPNLCLACGKAREILGDFDGARAAHERGLALARARGDRRAEWELLLALGNLWAGRDYAQAGRYLDQAYALALDIGAPLLVAHSLNRVGNWHMNIARPFDAEQYHLQALAIFREQDERGGMAETLDLLGMTMSNAADMVKSQHYYHEAVDLLRVEGDRQHLSSALAAMTITLNPLFHTAVFPDQELEQVLRGGEEAVRLAREMGWRSGEAFALWALALSLGGRGDYGHGLASAHQALEIALETGHRQWELGAHFALGILLADLCAWSESAEHLEQARTLATAISSSLWQLLVSGQLAMTWIANGRPARAAALLKPLLARQPAMQSHGERLVWLAAAELDIARERSKRALEILDRLAGATQYVTEPVERALPRLGLVRGRALAALGRYAEAEAALRAVLDGAGGFPVLQWRAHAELAHVYQAQGRRAAAARTGAARAARAVIDELAATVPDPALRRAFGRAARATLPR
jgi:tetratricopeptide (TPR) repeat protein